LYNIAFYIVKLIPFHLSALHPFPIPQDGMLPNIFYAAPILLALITWMVFKSKQYKHLYLFGFAFFIASISIVLQAVQVGSAVVAERYTYVPYVGLFFIISTIVYDAYCGKNNFLTSLQSKIPAIMLGIFAILAIISFIRLDIWKDGETMWQDTTSKYPETNHYAYYGLGNALNTKKDYPASLEAYNKAIAINPGFSSYFLMRSGAYSGLNKMPEAIADLNKCISLDKKSIQAYYNRGLYRTNMNDYAPAVKDFDTALTIDPLNTQCWFLRGLSKKNTGDLQGALLDYNKVIQLDSKFPNLYNNLANVYTSLQQYDNAINYYKQAIQQNPQDNMAIMNMAVTYLNKGDKTSACNYLKQAASMGNANAGTALKEICK
jgi:protein O-mannosyl-transferase